MTYDGIELTPFYCKTCGKLLCKGFLAHKADILEVKCRGCKEICTFMGSDADIIEKRSELIRRGLLEDPEID